MIKNWVFNETDEIVLNEIKDFIPGRVFDAHAHIYRVDGLNMPGAIFFNEGPREVGVKEFREYTGKIMGPKCLKGSLLMPYPTKSGDINKANDYLIEQLKIDKESIGAVLISPNYPVERVHAYLKNNRIKGLKPYHVYSNETSTWDLPISGYLPEWAWELADEKGLAIVLHIVREQAIADSLNQKEIVEMCTKYSGTRLILAHAGRCFHGPNAKKGLPSLAGLENIWFDVSGICEPEPVKDIIYNFGTGKLMWGSDFPVSHIRGRAVTIGTDFIWLQWDSVNWENLMVPCRPVLTGIESLRALKQACDDMGLDKGDVEDIFYNNAARLFGIVPQESGKTQELYNHAKSRIPGAVQLFSKRPELMAPGQWPAYFKEARGCKTWDIDGRHYYDMSTNGIGACLLGFRDPDVTRAVQRRINLGSMSTLNPPEEVELADMLVELHPWAEQVRFCRGGGEACGIAVRIARASSGRSMIAICGYHGWQDWYLAANLGDSNELSGHLLPGLDPHGVPGELRGTAVTFKYNDINAFKEIISKHGDKLAAVIMEPCRRTGPDAGFLEYIRDEAHRAGAFLIFDEVSIGWRLCLGGAHKKFGVFPDMAVFAKAMGNGHPIGAVIGTEEAMEGAHISFISSTYWTESVGPAAALAVLKKMKSIDVPGYIAKIGSNIMEYWKNSALKHGLPVATGESYPCFASFDFKHGQARELKTLYTQKMLERGFLAGTSVYVSMAHTPGICELYGKAIDEVFGELSDALKRNSVNEQLKGEAAQSGFGRLV